VAALNGSDAMVVNGALSGMIGKPRLSLKDDGDDAILDLPEIDISVPLHEVYANSGL
jgi:hypothetical protein